MPGSELVIGVAYPFQRMIDDAAKAEMFASSDAYVAPQTGGESFGIVLVEAMAAKVKVIRWKGLFPSGSWFMVTSRSGPAHSAGE